MKTDTHSTAAGPSAPRRRQLISAALALLVLLLAVGALLQASPDLFGIWRPGCGDVHCLRNATAERRCWALIGNDGAHLEEERAAGVQAKLFSLSWRGFAPSEGAVDQAYVVRKRAVLEQLRQAGFAVILNLGFHDTPLWLHTNYRDTYYVNQYGDRYQGEAIDSGNANLVFNPQLRGLVAGYVNAIFATLP